MIGTLLRFTARPLALIALVLGMQMGEIYRAQAQAAEAYALVDAVNGYRESLGLPRLPTSDALMVAAQRHAEWMAANFNYSHVGAGGTMPQDRAASAGYAGTVLENIGGGTNATTAWMVQFWDQTYVHQMAMRNPSATHLGAGFAANNDQRLFVLLVGSAGVQPPPQPVANTRAETGGNANSAQSSSGAAAQTSGSSSRDEAVRVASLNSIRLAEPAEDGSIVHIVEAGQTAWAIATRYEVDLQEVLTLNRLTENSVLQPGDRLIIRAGEGQAPPEPTVQTDYTVQANDSLWIIAARTNTTVEDLMAWNNLTEQDVIQPGDVLIIAPPTPVPTATDIPTATPASTPSPTATMLPTDTPAPTLPPPATEVAQVATSAPVLVEASAMPVQQDTRSLAALLLVGLVAIAGAVVGGVALWFALARGRKPKL